MDEREGLFRVLFESSPFPVFIADLAGFVVDCNPAAARLHDVSRSNLIGRQISQLFASEDGEHRIASSTVPAEFEGETLASARRIPVHVTTIQFEYLGNPALLLHLHDLTERRRFEHELRQAENRISKLKQENDVL